MSYASRRQFTKTLVMALCAPRLALADAAATDDLRDVKDKWMNDTIASHRENRDVANILQLSRFVEPMYFLLAPIIWKPNRGETRAHPVEVPQGFVTDLASIPRAFYSLLRPDGEYVYAAIVHDYLYWTQTTSRDEADLVLKLGMEDFKVGSSTIKTIYNAVRAGGSLSWRENAKLKSRGEKRILKELPKDPRTRWEDWKKREGVFR